MEKHKPYIQSHTRRHAHGGGIQPPFDTHGQLQSKLLPDEHDSGIEQTAIHDAHVSGKADRYSVRMTAAAQAAIPDAQRSVFCVQQTATRLASAV